MYNSDMDFFHRSLQSNLKELIEENFMITQFDMYKIIQKINEIIVFNISCKGNFM